MEKHVKCRQGTACEFKHPGAETVGSINTFRKDFMNCLLAVQATMALPDSKGKPIQDAEKTFGLMISMSQSLGVNCTFCHNTRAFYDGAQVTPQWGTASLGIAMVQELNNEYLISLEGLLPPERMGPTGDAPKAACATCHKGYQRPMQGRNVIGDWPELATSGEISYD